MWRQEQREEFELEVGKGGYYRCLSLWGSHLFMLFSVEDVNLAFLRSREDIKQDKKEFLNDSEWELLSVSSTYNILQSSAGDFAQIQFNVGPSPP